jgi:hypothetical protein
VERAASVKALAKASPARVPHRPKPRAKEAEFQGACNHCGIWGHRRSECRKLTAELAKAGGPKGKTGGKGGPSGGKGPAAAPIAQVEAGDSWAGDMLNDAITNAAAEFEEWNFDTGALCSVTPGALPGLVQCGRGQTAPGQASHRANPWSRAGRGDGRKTFYAAASARGVPTQNSFAALNVLTDDAEVLLAAVSGDVRGRVIEAVVDSGAVHSVTPPGVFPGPTVSSPWSRAGRGYRAANGTGIKNLGQVAVRFCTAEGDRCAIPFQVAEVDQPLLSVAHLTSAGNRVELGHASGRVVNLTTGRAIALERRGGVYIMRMFLADGAEPAPFRRQA